MHSLKLKPQVTHSHYSKVDMIEIWNLHNFFLIFFKRVDDWEGRQRSVGWLLSLLCSRILLSLLTWPLSDFLSPYLLLISLFVSLCMSVCLFLSLCQLFTFASVSFFILVSLTTWCFSALSLLFHPLPICVTLDFSLTLPSFLIIVIHFNIDFDLFLFITLVKILWASLKIH